MNTSLDVGIEIYVNSAIGNVIVPDVKKDYLILFNPDSVKFIMANNYKVSPNGIHWDSGEYYNSLNELIKGMLSVK